MKSSLIVLGLTLTFSASAETAICHVHSQDPGKQREHSKGIRKVVKIRGYTLTPDATVADLQAREACVGDAEGEDCTLEILDARTGETFTSAEHEDHYAAGLGTWIYSVATRKRDYLEILSCDELNVAKRSADIPAN